jgi:hypothetical protein
VRKDGVTVEVSIIQLEHETEWSLEVVNSANTSIVWDDLFASDDEAFAEFERTVAEEGIRAFLEKKRDPFPSLIAPKIPGVQSFSRANRSDQTACLKAARRVEHCLCDRPRCPSQHSSSLLRRDRSPLPQLE